MSDSLPVRLSPDGRTATWNPALTRARRVRVAVRMPGGALQVRAAMNSGRARVREGEVIECVVPDEDGA